MAILWSGLYPQIGNVRSNDVAFSMATTQSGYGYWVITPASASCPTVANIIAGRDATNQPCALGSSGVVTLGSGTIATTSGYALSPDTAL